MTAQQPQNPPQKLRSELSAGPITQLKAQIEQHLLLHSIGGVDIRCDTPRVEGGPASRVLLQRALSSAAKKKSTAKGDSHAIFWALEILDDIAKARHGADPQNRHDSIEIAEYWLLDTTHVELRVYRNPSTTGYRQTLLLQVGETASPLAFPQLAFTVQEPLPLFFLTRTTTGQTSHTATMLPLRITP